jgi:hypothetical protein
VWALSNESVREEVEHECAEREWLFAVGYVDGIANRVEASIGDCFSDAHRDRPTPTRSGRM